MQQKPSIIERAFQLANAGDCASVKDIRERLSREDYASVESYIRGASLVRQLQYLIGSARTAAAGPTT